MYRGIRYHCSLWIGLLKEAVVSYLSNVTGWYGSVELLSIMEEGVLFRHCMLVESSPFARGLIPCKSQWFSRILGKNVWKTSKNPLYMASTFLRVNQDFVILGVKEWMHLQEQAGYIVIFEPLCVILARSVCLKCIINNSQAVLDQCADWTEAFLQIYKVLLTVQKLQGRMERISASKLEAKSVRTLRQILSAESWYSASQKIWTPLCVILSWSWHCLQRHLNPSFQLLLETKPKIAYHLSIPVSSWGGVTTIRIKFAITVHSMLLFRWSFCLLFFFRWRAWLRLVRLDFISAWIYVLPNRLDCKIRSS